VTMSASRESLRRVWAPAIGWPAVVLAVGWGLLVGAFDVRLPGLDGVPIGSIVLLLYPAAVAYRVSALEGRWLQLSVAAIGAALPIGLLAAVSVYGALYEGNRYPLSSIISLGGELSWSWLSFFAAALAGSWVMRKGGRAALIAGSIGALAVFVVCYFAGAFLSHLGL
jgi:hypothetical protein